MKTPLNPYEPVGPARLKKIKRTLNEVIARRLAQVAISCPIFLVCFYIGLLTLEVRALPFWWAFLFLAIIVSGLVASVGSINISKHEWILASLAMALNILLLALFLFGVFMFRILFKNRA